VAYWRGRLAELQGDKASAAAFYVTAVRFPTTFYGQLAAAKVGKTELALLEDSEFQQPNIAGSESDVIQATRLFLTLGRGHYARAFALHAMIHHAGSPAEHVWLAKTILALTGNAYKTQTGVRLTKLAQRDGWALVWEGYPVIDLPAANTVEPALVFALIRQESEFMAKAKSWVGARGLMQLMHFTARLEARDLKVPYSLSRLTLDPSYNLRLGTVHMERLLKKYDGSYPLVLGAYNAGMHRVDRWLAYHGDPRKSRTVDWVDWIELIPFDETREYVKRVLEAHTIYRIKLGADISLGKLATHWETPAKDYEKVCKQQLAARTKSGGDAQDAVGAVVPLATSPKTSDAGAGTTDDKPDPFRLVRKDKPDNLPGTPPC
jgi:soluble lytic murein transglycosylase